MNPWEEDLQVIQPQAQVVPWEENLEVKTPRGANFAGAVRNVAQNIPVIGPYADEAEGLARSLIGGGDYEMWRRNAEQSALGNEQNTGYGRALGLGTNLAGNIGLAALTSGATLLPGVSAVQGGIEGFGRGDDLGSRTAQAGAGAALGAVIPAAFNRIFPTKSVQTAVTKSLAEKAELTPQKIVARAIQEQTTPEDVIAREVPRSMRPELWSSIRRESVGENVYRKALQEQAGKVYNKPYAEFIAEEVGSVSPKYASQLSKEMEKLKLDQLGEDIVGEIDARSVVMDAVNKVMRNAPAAEKEAVAGAMDNAIARWGIAKQMSRATMKKPLPAGNWSIGQLARKISAPARNLWNAGTLRAMTAGTPNQVSTSLLEKLTNRTVPDWSRSLLDAYVEDYERRSLK